MTPGENEKNAIEPSEVGAAFEAGAAAMAIEHRVTEIDGIPVAAVPRGMSIVPLTDVLRESVLLNERPPFKHGRSLHTDADSFIAHVHLHKLPTSALWASQHPNFSVTAIYDYHGGVLPGWLDHSAQYTCPFSDQFLSWTRKEDCEMGQTEFGDWIEDNLEDITAPAGIDGPLPAAVLEVARDLRIYTKGTFQRKVNRTTGESELLCKEEHGSASTTIPRRFFIGVPVLEGGQGYRIELRLRFALNNGHPVFSYKIHRKAELLREAFRDVHQRISDETGLPCFLGAPETGMRKTIRDSGYPIR